MRRDDIAGFFLSLMHARTNAHLLHLRTRTYAHHMALGDFYDDFLERLDELIETYQGVHGVVDGYRSGTFTVESEPIAFLEHLRTYIDGCRSAYKESELQNITDELQATIDRTLYKLKNLA